MTRQLGKAFQERSNVDEGLPGVWGEQGSTVIFAMGTREQIKKIMENKGTRNMPANKGRKH